MRRLGRSNPRITALRRAIRERPPGIVIVDGVRLVTDLVRWGLIPEALYLSDSAAGRLIGWPPLEAARQCWVVSDSVMERLAPTRHPQGVLAVVPEPEWPRWAPGSGVTVFLDAVGEPGNVGAVVRSAAALGAGAVLLGTGCADPFHPAAVRGSAGAVFRIPVVRDAKPGDAAETVRGSGGSVWAAAGAGEDAARWEPVRPALILLGNEGRGLSREALEAADGVVTIPLAREIESLNVAVAASILLWQVRESSCPARDDP